MNGGCQDGVAVQVLRKRRGRDRVLARTRTEPRGRWIVDRIHSGRTYARVPKRYEPGVGYCRSVRTHGIKAASAGRTKVTPRNTPVATVRALVRAVIARDGEKACALVTAEGRSVIDAPTQSGGQACVESVDDFHNGEIDVTLVRAHTVGHTPIRARVAVVLKREGAEERWKLYLVHRHRGWLVDDAQPVEARADSAR
jgi:hypothetical protein